MKHLIWVVILVFGANTYGQEYVTFDPNDLEDAEPVITNIEEEVLDQKFVTTWTGLGAVNVLVPDIEEPIPEIKEPTEPSVQPLPELEPEKTPKPLENDVTIEELGEVVIEDIQVEEEPVPEPTPDDILQYWHDVYLYLFGTTGLTLLGLLTRIGYLIYQTRTGKLIVKHVKNKVEDLEDDFAETFARILDLSTEEEARQIIAYLERRLKTIIHNKIPPQPAPPTPPLPQPDPLQVEQIPLNESPTERQQRILKAWRNKQC